MLVNGFKGSESVLNASGRFSRCILKACKRHLEVILVLQLLPPPPAVFFVLLHPPAASAVAGGVAPPFPRLSRLT